MRRGEIWTASGGFAGKPRPWTVLQSDRFAALDTVIMCPLTSYPEDYGVLRPSVTPTAANGLGAQSFAMVDKTAAVAKIRLGRRIGRLDPEDLSAIESALLIFLGIGPQT